MLQAIEVTEMVESFLDQFEHDIECFDPTFSNPKFPVENAESVCFWHEGDIMFIPMRAWYIITPGIFEELKAVGAPCVRIKGLCARGVRK